MIGHEINQTYGSAARFDTGVALSEDEIRARAPSVFATTAHESRSQRFQPIATIDVLRALQKEGFSVVGAKQRTTRDASRVPFTKHMLRLRRLDDERKYSVGDTVFEALLKNGNDGSSIFDLLAGLFRIRCLNSLVAMTSEMESIKVRHTGDVAAKVIEGTYSVLNSSERALSAPDQWSRITLDNAERDAFAQAAMVARFGDAEGQVHTAIKPQQLLIARRPEDAGNDLWRTFNVIQENAIRGGLEATGATRTGRFAGRPRRTTSREINGIDQDVKVNRALWTLGDALAKHKAAA